MNKVVVRPEYKCSSSMVQMFCRVPLGSANMKLLAVVSLVAIVALVGLMVWKPQEAAGAKKKELVVLCAAGLRTPMEEIALQYEKEYGVKVNFRYGASETLYSQLALAGDGDIFLPADEELVKQAQQKGLAREDMPVATLHPVLAVAKGNPKEIKSLDDLLRKDVRVAIANPEAAVGKLTKELLSKDGFYPKLMERVKESGSSHTTVVEVANALKAGTKADAGIVWDATVAQMPELQAIRVSPLEAGSSRVVLAVLKSAQDPTAALRFGRYISARDRGLEIFKKTGFDVVPGDKWTLVPTVTLFSGGLNRSAVDQTIADFEKREGVTVNRTYNGCGILVATMKAIHKGEEKKGFPDAYLACDVSFLSPVNDWFENAVNVSETDMVICTRQGNPHNIKTLEDLAKPGLKLGLADPTQSTLGALTDRLLQEHQVLEPVRKNQAFSSATADAIAMQMVEGQLDAGVIYLVNANKFKGKMEVVPIPEPHATAIQPYATAKDGEHTQLMLRLKKAITSTESKVRYEKAGFRFKADQ